MGEIPTGITQNVKTLMSKEIENIFDNTDLFNAQSSGDREICKETENLQTAAICYQFQCGEGLLFFTIVPLLTSSRRYHSIEDDNKPEEVSDACGKEIKARFKERQKIKEEAKLLGKEYGRGWSR